LQYIDGSHSGKPPCVASAEQNRRVTRWSKIHFIHVPDFGSPLSALLTSRCRAVAHRATPRAACHRVILAKITTTTQRSSRYSPTFIPLSCQTLQTPTLDRYVPKQRTLEISTCTISCVPDLKQPQHVTGGLVSIIAALAPDLPQPPRGLSSLPYTNNRP
jgi:hypothetical protein